MALEAVREHWLLSELFREPVGGWLGWGILTVAIVWAAYEGFLGDFWKVPMIVIPLAEVYPKGDPKTAGYLRLIGLVYLVLIGIFLVLFLFIG